MVVQFSVVPTEAKLELADAAAAAAARAVESVAKRIVPMFDRVLVERAEAVTRSKGGIVIPEKAQEKVLQATIVAAGPGHRNEKGDIVPLSVSVGDRVLLPEYGGTKVSLDDKDYFLFREHDILAKYNN